MPVAAPNDSASLVAAVRRDCFTANSDDNWTDEDILGIADDCIGGPIAAALKAAKQDWFAKDFDVALVADQSAYDVPENAMWSSVENVYLVDKTTGLIVSELANISQSQRILHQPGNDGLSGIPHAVWWNHTQMMLTPAPDSNTVAAYSLTVAGYRRPGQLCKTSESVKAFTISSGSMTVDISVYAFVQSLTAPPSGWSRFGFDYYTGYPIDVYDGTEPHTVKLANVVANYSSTAGPNTLLFDPSSSLYPLTAAQFATIERGDVFAMTGTTPFVPLPREAVPFLRRMIKKVILTAQTDSQALQAYLAEESAALAEFMKGMKNRHDGKGRKVSLWNAAGSRFMRRRW